MTDNRIVRMCLIPVLLAFIMQRACTPITIPDPALIKAHKVAVSDVKVIPYENGCFNVKVKKQLKVWCA